ncbi:MAG: nitroreductase family protein [Thermodesulfobacteriota bacterium]|nr:nitroreductase family protein [Thermodesulfobacteriota bacterium]
MEFKDLIKARRSCRSFEALPVSEGQLDAILDAGRWAPNPLNLQPWEFIIITEPEIKAAVRGVAEDAKQEVLKQNGPGWVKKYNVDFLEEAPVLVVVLTNPSLGGLGSFFGQRHGAIQAASACVQNMILAAADMGLGSLWFTFFRPEKLRIVLHIPEYMEIAAVIPFGKPKGRIRAPTRKDLIFHSQHYDASSE